MSESTLEKSSFHQLINEKWEKRYIDYIESGGESHVKSPFPNIQEKFIELLNEKDRERRRKIWEEELLVPIGRIGEVMNFSNPYYIGIGNPWAKVLFIGKELGFDLFSELDLFYDESVNNIFQWEMLLEKADGSSPEELLKKQEEFVEPDHYEKKGYFPLFPRSYYEKRIHHSHTWGMYSDLLSRVYDGLTRKELLNNKSDFRSSFFGHAFLTEINHRPAKYAMGNIPEKLTKERKCFLRQDFYRSFPVVVIGAKGYLGDAREESDNIKYIFNASPGLPKSSEKEVELATIGNKKKGGRKIIARAYSSEKQRILVVNQLSGSAGWSNKAKEELGKLMRSGLSNTP